MKINEMIKEYRRIISRKYSKEECLEIMVPLGIHEEVMNNIIDLICDQPERTSEEDHPKLMRYTTPTKQFVECMGEYKHKDDMRCSEPSNERDGVTQK